MRKICVINEKGGVGKTTTTVNLGAGLSRYGRRVLILDLDPQGNIASCLPATSQKGMFSLLLERADIGECLSPLGRNLDVVRSNEELAKAEVLLTREQFRESVLRRRMEGVVGYDYVLLDCPPSLGLLNQNAMLYSTEALIPTSTEPLGFEATKKMIDILKGINEAFDHGIRITKVVPTFYDKRNKICRDTLKEIQNEFYELTADPINVSSKLKEAPLKKMSIFKYDKNGRAAKDYSALVRAVLRDEEHQEEIEAAVEAEALS